MSAYSCEPDKGSEPGVGWNWAVQAARKGHEVHVITRANNRPSIEGKLRAERIQGLSFHYYDLPSPLPLWKKRVGYCGILAYYYLWQFGALRLARRLHREHRFDIAHHVTFVNDWMPSGVGWIGIPFVWGPIGGSTNVLPRSMREFIPRHGRRYEWTRRTIQRTLRSADPFVALTRKRADVILTFTEEARQGVPARHRSKARPVVHIGVSPSDVPEPTIAPGDGEVLTVVSGSRLVHWKGFDLLIEGFARFIASTDGLARLLITGDGPSRPYLEELIRSLNAEHSVQLLGHLPTRADVYRVLTSADLYALPTLRDGPPVAILEAMAAGRPILCLDRGATAEMIPDGVGFKIGVYRRAQVVEDIALCLAWVSAHRKDLAGLGEAAREHALDVHNWDRIGGMIDGLYRELTPEPSPTPSDTA